MPYDEFNEFCQDVWQYDHCYIIINTTRPVNQGLYIANFQQAYIPIKYITGKGLINTLLNKAPLPELHLKLPSNISSEKVNNGTFNNTGKYSYCGPGTKVKRRMKEGYKGVNSLDEACKRHDLAYGEEYSETKDRNAADDVLAMDAARIALYENKSAYERRDARLVTGIMGTKSRFGFGLPKVATKKTNGMLL
jgi:hypothetical protein